MMISPQLVYDELKSKSDNEVLSEIRKYRREISKLKNKLELPIIDELTMRPSPEVQIIYIRQYIDEAKRLLSERGIQYKPTKAEQASLEFNARLFEIMEIHIVREGYFIGKNKYIITCGEKSQAVSYENKFKLYNPDGWYIEMDRESFISELQNLYIGEWKSRYYICALDGEQWEITFKYKNDTKRTFKGSNAYPYNFDNLMNLLKIEEEV